MSSFADQLKSEIARIARKEARAETRALKKAQVQQRAEIAAIKRRLIEAEKQLARLAKAAGKSRVPAAGPDTSSASALRFRVAGFASLRKKRGLSAAEMGQLLGVSAQLAAIAAVRKLGKREVLSRLQTA